MKLRFFVLILTMSLFIPSCTSFQQAIPTQTSIPTLTATIEPTATITPTPEPAYDLCPNIENFRDCYVPEEELLDSSYWYWLNKVVAPTLLVDFKAREDQIRDDVPLNIIGLGTGSTFFYPNDGVYANEELTAPWNRKVTFAATSTNYGGKDMECLVLPVFYYDKETQQVFPVVTIQPIYHEEMLEAIMDAYLNEMNMPLIVYSTSLGDFTKENIVMTEPLVAKSYDKLSQDEIWERTVRFAKGDYSAFSSPDTLVRGTVASGSGFAQ